MGKPSGIRTGRKLRFHRRDQRWNDKNYCKKHSVTAFKANPMGGSTMAKGIVLEKIGIEAKQPNSAIRKCVRVQLIKNGKKIAAFVPRDGCLFSSTRMTKYSLPDLVEVVMPLVIS